MRKAAVYICANLLSYGSSLDGNDGTLKCWVVLTMLVHDKCDTTLNFNGAQP